MAVFLLLSSTGLSLDIHYCQDNIRGISLVGTTKSCHDKGVSSACHKSKKSCHKTSDKVDNAEKDNCCHNESIVIESSDIDASSPHIASIQEVKFEFVAALIAIYIFNYNETTDVQSYVQYHPPLPDRDIQVLYQSFLI